MRIKDKLQVVGGAVVLLLVTTFLPMQTACAGTITDAYNRVSNYVTTSRPYNYVTSSRAYNYVTNSRPYNYAVSGISSIVKSASDLAGKGGYPGMGGVTFTNVIEKLGKPKASLTRLNTSELSKIFEVNPNAENGPLFREKKTGSFGAGVSSRMESRIEYTVTDTKTNKSLNFNKSAFDEWAKKSVVKKEIY